MAMAIGAMNFTRNLNTIVNLAFRLPSFESSSSTAFFPINHPMNTTIKKPPRGSIIFTDEFRRPKTLFPKSVKLILIRCNYFIK